MVVIIYHDKVSQLQMSSRTSCFTGNSLHSTTISKERICVIVDQVESRFVEFSGCVCLRNCQADSVGESLAEWASGHFNTRRIMRFRMTRGDAIDLLIAKH